MSAVPLVFFFSGCSALIFETAWFHIMGIVLGSSVWSAASVLTAFMAGLASGNAIMAGRGHRLGDLVRAYIIIELVVACGGLLVVFLLPGLAPRIAALLSGYSGSQALLNLSRFAISFVFLLAPTVAMGMTLPVLQKLLHRYHPDFMQALGRLYGWNTIGAVCGALIAEFVLIHYLGIKSASLTAAAFNFAAALILLRSAGGTGFAPLDAGEQGRPGFLNAYVRFLAPPFVTGLLLLALEIVWFRCLLLLNIGSSIIFAIMLAVVLGGIGLGGLLVSRLQSESRARDRLLLYLPVVAAFLVVAGFYLYNRLYMTYFTSGGGYSLFIGFALMLMLPACIVSGMLFPLYGDKLYQRLPDTTRAAGALTLANTVGAALGSGLATFWLLPVYGLEMSIFVLALGYFAAVVPMLAIDRGWRVMLSQTAASAAAMLLIAGLFPRGMMADTHRTFSKLRFPDARLVMVREGLNETSKYYVYERFGRPFKHRLVTNAYSMSATDFIATRYMKMFVYLPHVLRQDLRKVLQISYGVGSTAEAVISLDTVESFDVVDISRDVLENSAIIHAATGRYPLRDPRTRAHIEDGRFFLQTTREKYDLITAEPPPPQQAGVVNLYTQEYFELIRKRLEPHGLATYWLPAHAMNGLDALAIIHAFCDAFEDCSLWAGGGLDFILLGSNGGIAPLPMERLERPWQSALAGDLDDIALEKPEQLAAAFMADAGFLQGLFMNVPPVTDNFPHRISPDEKGIFTFYEVYTFLLDVERRKKLLAESEYVKSIFPPELITAALPYIHYDFMIAHFKDGGIKLKSGFWDELADILTQTDLKVLPLLLLHSTPREQHIVDAVGFAADPEAALAYAKRLLARRSYEEAARRFEHYIDGKGGFANEPGQSRFYLLARALAGNPELPVAAGGAAGAAFQDWLLRRFPPQQPAAKAKTATKSVKSKKTNRTQKRATRKKRS